MREQYEEMRININLKIDVDRDYLNALKMCKNYLKMITKENDLCERDDYWFAYYNIALMNKKLGNIKEAIRYLKLSNQCHLENLQFIKTEWLLASCYESEMLLDETLTNKNTIKKIFRMYGKCSTYYRNVNIIERRSVLLFNMAKIKNNTKNMKLLIKVLTNRLVKNQNESVTYNKNEHLKNINLLQDMCLELIDIYILNNRSLDIFNLLNTIPFKTLKKDLITYVKGNKIFTA
jgi:hypothetical protein